MTRWQDMKLDLASAPLKSGQDDIAVLNELGEEGWELVAITGNLRAHLKKPMPESAPAAGVASVGNQTSAPAPRRRSKRHAETSHEQRPRLSGLQCLRARAELLTRYTDTNFEELAVDIMETVAGSCGVRSSHDRALD